AIARVMQGERRMQFAPEDRSLIVQLERNLLVVNQLQPYPRYEVWRPVVIEMLALYRELAQPRGIKRMGVRYLNQVSIPATERSLSAYFQIYPTLPPELSPHRNFLLRVEVPS